MVNKKKNEDKIEKPPQKKTTKKPKTSIKEDKIEIEKFPLSELLGKYKIKPLKAVGFLTYYGLDEVFKKEFESQENIIEFSEGEFEDMYKRYIEREI